MPNSSKIVTCCYCGARAALVLTGEVRHELACSSCGAPLHELKMMPAAASGDRELVKPSRVRQKYPKAYKSKKKLKKRKRSKGLFDHLADAADDVFDDLFDIFD